MARDEEEDRQRERGIVGGGRWEKTRGGREKGREKRVIYRSRGEGPGEDERQGEDG